MWSNAIESKRWRRNYRTYTIDNYILDERPLIIHIDCENVYVKSTACCTLHSRSLGFFFAKKCAEQWTGTQKTQQQIFIRI